MNDIKNLAVQLDFLTRDEQQDALRNIREIKKNPRNSLYVGQRLDWLQLKTAPFGYFTEVMIATGLALRTAYGYLYGYRNAVNFLPPGAVKAMMDAKLLINARAGYKGPLGIWTEVIQDNPPPQTGSASVYEKWAREIQEKREAPVRGKLANRIKKDPDELLRETYRLLERQHQRLPRAARLNWLKKLVGLAMTRFDVDEADFEPIPIPPDFARPRNQYSAR